MKNWIKIIVIFLIIFFNIFLYIIPSSYQKKYKVNGYSIIEKYDNKNKLYTFEINKDDKFVISVSHNYFMRKKLITKIKKVNVEDGYCIVPESKYISLYPLCKVDNKDISYHLVSDLQSKVSKKYYEKISNKVQKNGEMDVYFLNNHKYLLWNYTSFNYLNENDLKTIKLFKNDYYQIDLASQINNYLFIPDYDQGYSFNRAYIINMKNGKKEKWNIKYDISLQSRIVGTNNKSIYLVDEKNKIMYEIVPHKKKIRKISGRILENNRFKKYSINTIINDKLVFKNNTPISYKIIGDNLYQINGNNKTLLNDNKITEIVYYSNDTVYYLIKDTLYMYNSKYGNVKLIKNFEWEFNYHNLIFIY